MNSNSVNQPTGSAGERNSPKGDLDLGQVGLASSNPKVLSEYLEVSNQGEISPVIRLVDKILIIALNNSASDIDIEPSENLLLIRFFQDGVLLENLELPKSLAPAITSRLKIMAYLDLAERRKRQHDLIRRSFQGRTIDFRVLSQPSQHGEKVLIRLLVSDATELGLDSLANDPIARVTGRAETSSAESAFYQRKVRSSARIGRISRSTAKSAVKAVKKARTR